MDENASVGDDVMIGHDLEHDRARHHVTESGIVVVEASAPVESE
ncbi:MAG: hypothetical protein ABSH47_13780 [Bryobacteraceae bacterium]